MKLFHELFLGRIVADVPISTRGIAVDPLALAGWATVGALGIAAALAIEATGMPVDLASGWQIAGAILILGLIAVIYRTLRPSPRLSLGVEIAVQLICILLPAGLLVQACAILGADIPYIDDALWEADQFLYFDWLAANGWVDTHPVVSLPLSWAYGSIAWQFPLAGIALTVLRQEWRLRRFAVAMGLTLAATCAIFPFAPALGYDAFLGLGFGEPARHMEALRTGGIQEFRLDELVGVVTFPSFHTAAAVVFAWAMWGVRWLRWPGLVLNVAMIASTPFHGSHYLVDVIVGAIIAGLAIIATGRAAPNRMATDQVEGVLTTGS